MVNADIKAFMGGYMKKRILLCTLLMAVFSLVACVKEEEQKVEKPLENVNSLLEKYGEGETEETSGSEVDSNNEENSESETIDYDKIDQDIINQIVASGGNVTSGEELKNNMSNNAYTATLNGIYYSTEGFTFKSEADGIRTYTANDMLEAVAIYAYRDTSKTFTGQATINTIEVAMLNIYGNYISKSTYVNSNGIEFTWYKYDQTNDVNNNAIAEVFLYSDGIQTIQVEVAANAALGRISDRLYGFINSIKMQ